ncbi:MAG: hypothetical protein ACRDQZ_20145 [Mycobacteriales bacterium]
MAVVLVVAVATAGCLGSAHTTQPLSTHMPPPSTPSAPPPQPSTVARYEGHAKTCPRPQTYTPKLSPSHGSAGTRAVITGTLPLYGENGKLNASFTTKLVGWWNLSFAHWFSAAGKPPKPVAAEPGPVFPILVVAVPTPNPCTYRLVLYVPNVAAGTYPIDILTSGGRSTASLAPVNFSVN